MLDPVPQPWAWPTERLGVCVAWQRGDEWLEETLQLLEPPLWHNWIFDHIGRPGRLPMVYSLKDGPWADKAIEAANSRPDVPWLAGNEPEAFSTTTDPSVAVQFARRWFAETTNETFFGGVIVTSQHVTPWEAWLDAYLDQGGPVPPGWQIHIYFTGSGIVNSLETFEAWMRRRGVERPYVVSEFCYTGHVGGINAQAHVMAEMARELRRRPLLQAATWYSDDDYWKQWTTASLREGRTTTWLGERYKVLKAVQPTVHLPFVAR